MDAKSISFLSLNDLQELDISTVECAKILSWAKEEQDTEKKATKEREESKKKADREKEEWKKAADRMILREKAEKHRLDQRKHVSIVTPEGVEEEYHESFLKKQCIIYNGN